MKHFILLSAILALFSNTALAGEKPNSSVFAQNKFNERWGSGNSMSYNALSDKPTIPAYFSEMMTGFTWTVQTRSIVTSTSGGGFLVSSTKASDVNYAVTVSTAVQIGVTTNVGGYIVLEICATNSATAGDWIDTGSRVGLSQNIGLALALSSTQTVTGTLHSMVPPGFYVRLRSVNSNGTPTYAFNSGQELTM